MKKMMLTFAAFCAGLSTVGFWPGTSPAEEGVALKASTATVGKYEKVEFVVVARSGHENPFDPQEIDVTLMLTAPDGRQLSVPAFHCQDFQRRRLAGRRKTSDWIYPVGSPVWKARFAPTQTGTYAAVARLRRRGSTVRSESVRFESTASARQGFLGVSKRDPRFLEFTEGEPFFAIGQNLAFIGQRQPVDLAKAEIVFAKLSHNGANFVRVWTCCQDWAMAIEARKSAWGRSWQWRPPLVRVPDSGDGQVERNCVKIAGNDNSTLNVSPSHAVAVRPNTRYVVSGKVKTDGNARLSVEVGQAGDEESYASGAEGSPGSEGEWSRFSREFTTGSEQWWLGRIVLRLKGAGTVLLDGLSLKEATGGPQLLWEADVNRPPRGHYNQVDCFMLDELVTAAEQNGIYLQLCLITRDLYMKSLKDPQSREYDRAIADAKKLLRYAVARWGYSTNVAVWEYFNEMDPNLPTDRFYAELGEYLEEIDVYCHLRTTSTWHPSPNDWRHPELDVAQLHHYLRPVSGDEWKDAVAVIVDKTRFLQEKTPRGPVMIGEFGLADERWGRSNYMSQDRELVHFHNALWASALSGASGTALFWWWEQLDVQDCYHHYRPLATFLEDVPFTTAGLRETRATISAGRARVLGLQGADCVYLWLFSPQAAWWNVVVQKTVPTEIKSAMVEISGLAPGPYRVVWWDTRQGRIVAEQDVPVSEDTIELAVPAFFRDLAAKITPGKRGHH